MDYAESVAYMQGLLRFGEKYGNQRFEELLRRLGSPHCQFLAIHVAGTKGKGSTTSFIASVLHTAGFRTGSYLSPFVYDLRERIQIDGKMIPKDDFARWVTTIRPHIDSIHHSTDLGQTTEFELKTAVAFCFFAEQKVDYAVVEVGLGGRLDATNVIPPPLVSIITNIGFDHVELLGDTLELIAGEKAGILKTGSSCITGIDGGPALQKVTEVCAERSVPLTQILEGRDWVTEEDGSLTVSTRRRRLTGINLRMRGEFQRANAALAISAIDSANIPLISDSDVKIGLETAYAPGRLEVVRKNYPTVVIDAAHNELAARVLTESLIKDFSADHRPLILVIGMSHRHEPADLLTPLLTRLRPELLVATEPSFRPRPARDIVSSAKALAAGSTEVVLPVTAAAERAIAYAENIEGALVVITGSFFTIGDIDQSLWLAEEKASK